jgi:hypothetical protein
MRKKMLAIALCLCLVVPMFAVFGLAAQPAREEYQRCVNLDCRYNGNEHPNWNPGTFYRCPVCGDFSQDPDFVCSCPDEPTDIGTAGNCPICGKDTHRNFWIGLWHAILSFFRSWKFTQAVVPATPPGTEEPANDADDAAAALE